MLIGLLFFVLSVVNKNIFNSVGMKLCVYLMHTSGLLDILSAGIVMLLGCEKNWMKNLMLYAVVISSGAMFFLFPLNSYFLLYGPVLISAVYYNRSFVRGISVTTYILYAALLWLNVILEKYSPLIASLHAFQEIRLWQLPDEVLNNYFIPHTVIFALVSWVCTGLAGNGRVFMEKQAAALDEINAIESELEAAFRLQISSLPEASFETAGGEISVSAAIKPAKTVGGDFYDYFIKDGNLVILAADVSDKGLPAAMFMMRAKNAVRLASQSSKSLAETVAAVNRALCDDNPENMFVTMWIGEINIRTGSVNYINCGHMPPVIKNKNGQAALLKSDPQPILGVFNDLSYSEDTFKLLPSETVFLYTDGITDAVNRENGPFDIPGLLSAVKETDISVENPAEKLMSSVETYAEGTSQFDDMTVITASFNL